MICHTTSPSREGVKLTPSRKRYSFSHLQQLSGLILDCALQESGVGFLRGDDSCVPQESADDLKSNAFVECIDSEGVACHVEGNGLIETQFK